MSKRVVSHEIKLEKSVKIILGIFAVGVFMNSFSPAFDVKEAFAELDNTIPIDINLRFRNDPTYPIK